jgi:DNA-directed RNA polymerase subunit RPC12/RpoP
MKRSKKGKPMSYCPRCKKDTVDIQKMGGIICSQCAYLKVDYEKGF